MNYFLITVLLLIFGYGAPVAILYYCLAVTKDYRKRRRFSDATRHLDTDGLRAGLERNMRILAAFLRGKSKVALEARRAESALVMATVLREHIARIEGHGPLPRYLRSRRAVWREAKRMSVRGL